MPDNDKDYHAGLLEGRVRSLESEMGDVKSSLRFTNRAIWALGGAIFIVNFAPAIKSFFGVGP